MRENGYILTNAHVVEGTNEVNVAFGDEAAIKGFVVGRDRSSDIEVIKVERYDLPTIKLGDSDEIKVGQVVLALETLSD